MASVRKGAELTAALETFDPAAGPGAPGDLSAYILMQRIFPPSNVTLCLRAGKLVELETLSELGIYGGAGVLVSLCLKAHRCPPGC